jgi:hypothetical protein
MCSAFPWENMSIEWARNCQSWTFWLHLMAVFYFFTKNKAPWNQWNICEIILCKIYLTLKGSHFDTQNNAVTIMKGLSEKGFQQCFQARQTCWNVWNQKANTLNMNTSPEVSDNTFLSLTEQDWLFNSQTSYIYKSIQKLHLHSN